MFGYYCNLALRSFGRNKVLTLLMVMTLGFGVAAVMTTWSVLRAVSGDPIPWKSSKLFLPQIDPWGPKGRKDGEPPDALAYNDALALQRAHRAKLQSALYFIAPTVTPPAQTGLYPVNVSGHAVFAEFFPLTDAPFKYGGGWSTADDERRAQIAVIGDKLNRKVFGGANSVGRSLDIGGRPYRIAGVLGAWNPQPRFYDVVNSGGFTTAADDVFLPFNTAIDANISNDGNTNCAERIAEPGFIGLQHSSCVWALFIAELDDATQAAAYKNFLDDYAREQQRVGRFDWAPNTRLRNLHEFFDFAHVVPADTKVSLLVALGLLAVCLINTAGLLLAKFLRRSGEIGVRRALGASRSAIYTQFLVEAGTIGLVGGALGLVLTGLGVLGIGWVLPEEIAMLARLDFPLLALALSVAMSSAALAGLYPAFRAARVQPAWQLKSN